MSQKRNVKVKTYNPQTRSRNRKRTILAILAVTLIAIVAIVLVTQTGLLKATSSKSSPSPTANVSPTPAPTSNSPYPSVSILTSPAGEYSTSSTKVLVITSKGDMVIQLRNDKPITTANFVNLVNEGYYNGTTFMRVIAGFMIQGGEGTTTVPSIQDEIGNDNHNYNMTIAMANTGQPNSASSQFFINVADNNKIVYQDGTHFDASYAVFGQVIYGQNLVMAISNTAVGYSSEYNANVKPLTTVTLIGAVIMP